MPQVWFLQCLGTHCVTQFARRTASPFGRTANRLMQILGADCVIGLSLAQFWKAFGISGVGGFNTPTLPPRYATALPWG
jgi:hypothetical protein